MQVIFLFPLGLSVGGTMYILINNDFGWFAKAFAVAITGGIDCLPVLPGDSFLRSVGDAAHCLLLARVLFSDAKVIGEDSRRHVFQFIA